MKNIEVIDTLNCYIIGDTHGEWKYINIFLNKKNPSAIIIVGDFGYFPAFDKKTTLGERKATTRGIIKKKWYQCGIKNPNNVPIYFIDGNHDDHFHLREVRDNNPNSIIHEICDNVFYIPRGIVLKTTCKRKILFMGGAASIDRNMRTEMVDWWRTETISQSDIYDLPDVKVDIIISHTCPRDFLPEVLKHDLRKISDPSYDALSFILHRYNPKLWYFGHFHKNITGFHNDIKWFCLNMAKNSGWFQKLLK